MSEYKQPTSHTKPSILLLGAILGGILLLSLGFVAGRATSSTADVAEPVAEAQEVEREVTREVRVIVTAEATAVPPTLPTAEVAVDADEPPTATAVATDTPILPTPTPNPPPPPVDLELDESDLSTFLEAWQLIENEFDGTIPSEEALLNAAISGSIETLDDDFTRYFPPDVAERLRLDRRGSFSGIGAYVNENEAGQIEIVRPITGQPADLVGLMPGDIISAVDGNSVVGMSLDEVLLLVRGPADTTVILTVLRVDNEQPLEFAIVRATVELPIVAHELLQQGEDRFAYVRLANFNRNATTAVADALNEMLPQNPAGIIFDLRDNGGGFLDQSVDVADIFLPESVILFERNNRGLEETFRAEDGDIAETLPLVVLVNANSASASEIVAGAIQDNGRGILIGETTFGKGSVQLVHNLSDGSELRVTIARWYTPNNHTIDKEGITPDIEVELPAEFNGENDTQLQRALEYLQNGG